MPEIGGPFLGDKIIIQKRKIRQQDKKSGEVRKLRAFSEEFTHKKVLEINRKITITEEISKQYDGRVNSFTKSVKKYSVSIMAKVRMIAESKNDMLILIEY